MSNYQLKTKYNNIPYDQPSMHSTFDIRQSEITIGAGRGRGYRNTACDSGRGKGQRYGYGYVGIQKRSRPEYRKHSDLPKSVFRQSAYNYERRTTKSKYRRTEIIKDEIKPNMIEVEGNGSIQQYVDSSLYLFSKEHKLIYIIATGRAISKAINCVEIIKRKQFGLYQESSVEHKIIKEIWIPLEQCLKTVIVERELIYINVILTFDKTLVNKNNIGYQDPISWIDLGDAREIHNTMKGKMGTLQNKYDVQSKDLSDSRVLYGQLQIDYDLKADEFSAMKYKYDTQQGIMNKQTADYDNIMEQYTHLKKQFDLQKLQFDDSEIKKENKAKYNLLQNNLNKEKYNVLQNKFDKLQKHNDDREEKLRIKKTKFDDLDANGLVDVIVSINPERYTKYKDTLLKKFTEEGVDGSCLHELTKNDLHGFGIQNYKDRVAIHKAIKEIFNFV